MNVIDKGKADGDVIRYQTLAERASDPLLPLMHWVDISYIIQRWRTADTLIEILAKLSLIDNQISQSPIIILHLQILKMRRQKVISADKY